MEGSSNPNPSREATCIDMAKVNPVTWKKSQTKPEKLRESAGWMSCCIFRVSRSLVKKHEEAYLPQIVSIGPYHHGRPHTQMMEEHKWHYRDFFLSRFGAGQEGKIYSILLEQLAKIETEARECYSEKIHLGRDEFTMMMLLDGCFIVELLLRKRILDEDAYKYEDDPIFSCPWILPFIRRDLIKLENQIPLLVLQLIYDLIYEDVWKEIDEKDPSLPKLAFTFFSSTIERPEDVIRWYETIQCGHLLDMFRDSFTSRQVYRPRMYRSATVIQCATRLRKAGIKFKLATEAYSFLGISFKNGVLKIPTVNAGDFHATFLRNCVAFEQNYKYISNDFTAYVTFMGRLIDTENDVGLLIDEKIMYNSLGTEKEVAMFYNDIGCHAIIDIHHCYLSQTFDDVNEYYGNTWHVRLAEFKSRYFSSPWTFLSAVTALLLLLLSVAQTIFAILGLGDYRIKV